MNCNLHAKNDPFYYYSCFDELNAYNDFNSSVRKYLSWTVLTIMIVNALMLFLSWLLVSHSPEQLKYLKVLAFTSFILIIMFVKVIPMNNMVAIAIIFGISIVIDIYYRKLQNSTALLIIVMVANAVLRIIYGIDNMLGVLQVSYDNLLGRIRLYRTNEEYVEVKLPGMPLPHLFLNTKATGVRLGDISFKIISK